MKTLLIFLFFVIKSCGAQNFDDSFLFFVGSNYFDYKKLSINCNFASIYGTKYFNPSKPSVLIIHGWTQNYFSEFASTLVNAFLTRPEYNIIFAGWGRYADNIDLNAAAVAISGVAQVYVEQLNQLKSAGYDLTKFYVVGHSLGGTLAGKIGELFRLQNILVSRITALDAAGGTYKGNAKFVDVIHTYTDSYKNDNSTGDVDFWPNAGRGQTHCFGCYNINLLNSIGCTLCNHAASWRFYAESVRSTVPNFKSLRCPTSVYASNTCTGPATAYMGFHASSISQPGNYYLTTRAVPPYSY